MDRKDRAKQFMPFDALKGLKDALSEKEIEYEERKELSEDKLKELENEFNKINIGSKIKIKYYKNKQYVEIAGVVTKIDYIKKKIGVDGVLINLSDILSICVF